MSKKHINIANITTFFLFANILSKKLILSNNSKYANANRFSNAISVSFCFGAGYSLITLKQPIVFLCACIAFVFG
jgi:hypothetical protein